MATIGFPSGALYVEALQNTGLCFQDVELRGSSPRTDKLGRPRAISGNFASVFSLTVHGGRRYAVKCFTREVVDQESRYRAISDHLAGLTYPWKVGFDYLSKGVLVEGIWYPALKMEWVDAISLTRWIEQHLHESDALASLADSFASLVAEMSASDIGHGDLQHGNLLVAEDGTLRLVDYDGMYVPTLAGRPAVELGHRNYQLPTRAATDFDSTIDRFSTWVVYLSLVALAVDPSLWTQLRERDAEQLLLAEDDYREPSGSYRLGMLANHPNRSVRTLAEEVQRLLQRRPRVPPELSPVELHVDVLTAPTTTTAPAAGGLPAWMADHVTPESLPKQNFSCHVHGLRSMGIFTIFTIPVAAVAAAFGMVSSITLPALLVVIWICWSVVSYRRQPETSLARSAKAAARESGRRVATASGDVTRLEKKARDLDRSDVEMKTKFATKQQNLQLRHQKELAGHQRRVQQDTAAVEARQQQLKNERARALGAELKQVQDEHVLAHLARMRISEARIHGIGPTLVDNLRGAGINTAADFTGVTYSSNRQYQSRVAYLRLVNGQHIRVQGVGEVKAAGLEHWRMGQLQRAQRTQPDTLSVSRKKLVEDRFTRREYALLEERKRVGEEGGRQRAILVSRHAADQAALANEAQLAASEIAREKVVCARSGSDARNALSFAQRKHAEVLVEAESYSRISYSKFVLVTMTRSTVSHT